MKTFSKILRGIVKYSLYDKQHTIFQLKVIGANPDPLSLMFTCMDSRVIQSRYTGSDIGDNYVIKNAGNFVPFPSDDMDQSSDSAAGALELTCVRNKVRHVLVSGHSDCKAMKLLYELRHDIHNQKTGTPLELWTKRHGLRTIEKFNMLSEGNQYQGPLPFLVEPNRKIEVFIDPENRYSMDDKLSLVNCVQQLENIAAYPFLKTRLCSGDLLLHALWYDVFSGQVLMLSHKQKRFVEINDETYFDLMTEVNEVAAEE